MSGISGVTRRWRQEEPVVLPTPAAPRRRRLRAFFVLAAMLAVAGAFAGVLSWISPVPNPYLVPLWITEYQARQIAFNPMAALDRESILQGGYFSRLAGQALSGQEGNALRRELVGLASLASGDAVVIYLSAHAILGDKGQLYIMPGDASPDNPATWLLFKDILERIRDCPARSKLLVLDIMKPLAAPRLGMLYHDIAAAVPEELKTVSDPDRLVLCACSAGQHALIAPELGRSVFSFYFEEGLRGYAEGFRDDGLRDGQIWVKELAAFVRARVDRWAQRVHGLRQTPTLYGSGRDFPLIALDHGQPREHLGVPKKVDFPDWLSQAWKVRDGAWQNGAFALDPRAFQKLASVLQDADVDWRSGIPLARIRDYHLALFERVQATLEKSPGLVQPVALSLAQEKALGKKGDDAVRKSVQELFTQVPRQAVGLKPDEAAKVKAKLVDEFRTKVKDASSFALEEAVFAWMVADGKRTPETFRLADEILFRPELPRPLYVETLFLRQLAELIGRMPVDTWPAETVARALDMVQSGEESSAHPDVFPLLSVQLNDAAVARHEGEVRLFARGYASLADADQLLKYADQRFQGVLAQANKIQKAHDTLAQALAILPFYLPFLDTQPHLAKTFEAAAQATNDLAGLFSAAAKGTADPLLDITKVTTRLGELLDDLHKPFHPDEVARLIKLSALAQARAADLAPLDALLSVPLPWLSADARQAIWSARHALAQRLGEDTLKLDHAEDERRQITPASEPVVADALIREAYLRAADRGRALLVYFQLAGLSRERLQPFQDALAKAMQTGSFATWGNVGVQVRHLWAMELVKQYQETSDPARREFLSWLFAPTDTVRALDDADPSPTTRLRLLRVKAQWTWLGDHYRYLARDYQGLGLDSAAVSLARKFYAHAATNNQEFAQLPPESFVVLQPTVPAVRLSRSNPILHATLQVQQMLPAGPAGPIEINLIRPDQVWLQVSPEKYMLAAPRQPLAAVSDALPVTISLKSGSDVRAVPAPAGLLAQARLLGRVYHTLFPVSLQDASQDVQVVFSASGKEPAPALDELRLRPNGFRTPVYVFVKNHSNRPRKVSVEITVGEQSLPMAPGPLILQPGEQRRLKVMPLPAAPPTKAGKDEAPASLEVKGPVTARVLDAENQALLDQNTLKIDIASPREYVKIADILYDPAGPKNGNKNKLTVKAQTLAKVLGPPIPVELILPAQAIPGFKGVEGGTFQGLLPSANKTPPITLFAEGIKLTEGEDEDGPVYLNVDGVARAFLFRVSFARRGDPFTPRGDGRPALRIDAPALAAASPQFAFKVEVDNPPAGAKLEVSLGRMDKDSFTAEAVQIFDEPRQRRIGLNVEAASGALLLEAALSDWTATFNTSRIFGPRFLRARLLDDSGKELLQTVHRIVLDSNTPVAVTFVDPPEQAKKGSVVTVQAQAAVSPAGVAQAVFFLGKPEGGKIPPGAATFPGNVVDAARNVYAAKITLPDDKKGPTPLSVQFTNKVGLASYATTTLDITDSDLAKGPGKIQGKVSEGPRPQGGLVVILKDEKGKDVAKVKTKDDGSFLFDKVPPGKYRVYCFKPETMRRANVPAVVEANKTTPVNLALAL